MSVANMKRMTELIRGKCNLLSEETIKYSFYYISPPFLSTLFIMVCSIYFIIKDIVTGLI